jgi:hypothetical protein
MENQVQQTGSQVKPLTPHYSIERKPSNGEHENQKLFFRS